MSEEPPMPPESSLSQPAVEKESEAEESEAVPSIAAAEEDSVVTLPDLEQYVAEHGATKARLDVKFNPDAPRFTFQRLEDETATTLMDWYSEAGFLESLQMKPQTSFESVQYSIWMARKSRRYFISDLKTGDLLG